MPARRIPTNTRSMTGQVAHSGGNGAAAYESSLERDLFCIFDFDYNVDHYEEQPLQIGYRDGEGRERTYTPDVLVFYRRDVVPAMNMRPWLCEVKYRDDLRSHWKCYKPKFKAARRYARQQGWQFRILTEREIRTPYLKNAKFLRKYYHRSADLYQKRLILDALVEMRETDPEALLLAIFQDKWKRAELLPVLWHLVAHRRIGIDLTRPLNMHSRIWTTY